MTFAMMVGCAHDAQTLMLFGYVESHDPKLMPTAVVTEEQSPVVRTILQAENSGYYHRLTT